MQALAVAVACSAGHDTGAVALGTALFQKAHSATFKISDVLLQIDDGGALVFHSLAALKALQQPAAALGNMFFGSPLVDLRPVSNARLANWDFDMYRNFSAETDWEPGEPLRPLRKSSEAFKEAQKQACSEQFDETRQLAPRLKQQHLRGGLENFRRLVTNTSLAFSFISRLIKSTDSSEKLQQGKSIGLGPEMQKYLVNAAQVLRSASLNRPESHHAEDFLDVDETVAGIELAVLKHVYAHGSDEGYDDYGCYEETQIGCHSPTAKQPGLIYRIKRLFWALEQQQAIVDELNDALLYHP
eukprot:gnl/MRDRNA2_/MRDRNA2_346225_c0_seq1.p1 gnl/MRDRNA2_/MRDRNA2_346225_c0~~gnl/MRDRNA2_/MRDRNA2_346225_c0_seq1.p1  ORF type:complete len:300 (+),score=47.52 gnl/MRDRNA2_/MRDRNA2_346225_c0_seq1:3-902(+)